MKEQEADLCLLVGPGSRQPWIHGTSSRRRLLVLRKNGDVTCVNGDI